MCRNSYKKTETIFYNQNGRRIIDDKEKILIHLCLGFRDDTQLAFGHLFSKKQSAHKVFTVDVCIRFAS